MMKLLIVDDHVLFREGLAAILQPEPDLEIVGLAGCIQDAIEIVKTQVPDVILMDLRLPDGNGIDATRTILNILPKCKVVMLTISEEDENLFASIRNGARGYLLKDISPSKLIAALKSVYQGESALSRSMTLRLMEELARAPHFEQTSISSHTRLTGRELEVLSALANGASNQEISEHFILSRNTIKFHIHSILKKLNLESRRQAAVYARQHGLS